MSLKRITTILLVYMLLAVSVPAAGQDPRSMPPPHQPGTICFTPTFWCWAVQPGPPAARCGCPTPSGWVDGVLG